MTIYENIIKNGNLIDYKTKVNGIYDVLIEDEKVSKICKNIEENADKIIDCTNLRRKRLQLEVK